MAFILSMLMLAAVTSPGWDGGAKATYVGGSIPGLPDPVKGKIDTTHPKVYRFDAGEMEVNVPWERINMLEYGQKVGRRIGLAIVVSPLFLMTKSRKHFLTVSFLDEKERQQALVFELHKDRVRSVLVTMEARTGLRVEFQDNEARFGEKDHQNRPPLASIRRYRLVFQHVRHGPAGGDACPAGALVERSEAALRGGF
ncbi:MAG: hypothetical protein U5J83_03880 [Bryobacterales bacterium]|nr:hypothetical protein [Bryobacterales bacterium]